MNIRALEDLPIVARIGIGIAALILALLLLVMASADAEQTDRLEPSPYDAELLGLERQAIDKAFIEHFALLYSVWMKDPNTGPSRAKVGAGHARKAYVEVRKALEQRERLRQ